MLSKLNLQCFINVYVKLKERCAVSALQGTELDICQSLFIIGKNDTFVFKTV